jgi:hypothetical protein
MKKITVFCEMSVDFRRPTITTVSPTDYHSTRRSTFINHPIIRHYILVAVLTGMVSNRIKKSSVRDVIALKGISIKLLSVF